MAVKVLLPTALRSLVGNQSEVELAGSSVEGVLKELVGRFPELQKHLYSEEGQLRNFVNVYVNDEDVRHLEAGKTQLKTGDVISIVPSIAGGRPVDLQEAAAGVELSPEEIRRYNRHIIMPEMGLEGQKKLKAASILLVGTGGLGSPLGLYLAAAGIGRLGLVDFDVVDYSNLQRQIIHTTRECGATQTAFGAGKNPCY